MGSRVVQAPPSSKIPLLYVVAGLLLFAAALGASLGFGASARIEVDGSVRHVPEATTIADLKSAGHLAAHDGNVLSAVTGKPVRTGVGDPLRVTRNGRPVDLSAVVYDGDVIESTSGKDAVERVVTVTRAIEVTTTIVGKGPLMTLASPGSVGVREVRLGALSGEELTSTVVTPATPMVVRRYSANPADRLVALTFDDGPWAGQTDQILSILRDEGIKATFFMLGYSVRKNPALAKRVADEGHLIGNHTMGHTMLTEVKPTKVDAQIAAGQKTIVGATGVEPRWFRPPGGDISASVWSQVRNADLRVAMWDVDPKDWRRPPAAQLARYVVNHVRPGAIVLLHDGGGNRSATVAALPRIIKELKAAGYRFVTGDQLSGP